MNEEQPKSWVDKLSDALLREPTTQQQLLELLHEAFENKLLDQGALSIIESVLGYSELHARDVMIPRGQMVVVDADMSAELALDTVSRSQHSRFPIIDQSRDQVIGVLLAKDLLPLFANNKMGTLIETLARPVHMVPESKRLDTLLKDFQKNRSHMAMVVDEYGGVAGLITIEDVLEQIVGNIEDETDVHIDQPLISLQSDNSYLVNALTSIDEFNQQFQTNFSDEEHDTIAGLVIKHFGHVPRIDEHIAIGPVEFTITNANSRRLSELRVVYQEQDEQN